MKRGVLIISLFLVVIFISGCVEMSPNYKRTNLIMKDSSSYDPQDKIDEIVSCIVENTPECIALWDLNNNYIVNVIDLTYYVNDLGKDIPTMPRILLSPSRGDVLMSIENVDIDAGTLDIYIDPNGNGVGGFSFLLEGLTVESVSPGVMISGWDYVGNNGNFVYGVQFGFVDLEEPGLLITIQFSGYLEGIPNSCGDDLCAESERYCETEEYCSSDCAGDGCTISFDLGTDANNDGWDDNNVISTSQANQLSTDWGCYGDTTIYGCTDSEALNYCSYATEQYGDCHYEGDNDPYGGWWQVSGCSNGPSGGGESGGCNFYAQDACAQCPAIYYEFSPNAAHNIFSPAGTCYANGAVYGGDYSDDIYWAIGLDSCPNHDLDDGSCMYSPWCADNFGGPQYLGFYCDRSSECGDTADWTDFEWTDPCCWEVEEGNLVDPPQGWYYSGYSFAYCEEWSGGHCIEVEDNLQNCQDYASQYMGAQYNENLVDYSCVELYECPPDDQLCTNSQFSYTYLPDLGADTIFS